MGFEDVDVSEARRWTKMIDYAEPGAGKTRFSTAYPDSWGEGIYVAYDEGSESLDSVLAQYRGRLHVRKPVGDDPISNLNELAIHDWRADYPKANVLIVDTFTRAVKEALFYSAKMGFFTDRAAAAKGKADAHIVFGPKGAEITQALPMEGDYGGVQSMIFNWLRLMFWHQRDMHVILNCHEAGGQPNKNAPYMGGPATVGKALLKDFAQDFPIVVRLQTKTNVSVGGSGEQTVRVVRADMHGEYLARIKEGSPEGNPMPIVKLNTDPRNWWDTALAKGVIHA